MISLSDVTDLINQLLPEPHAGLLTGILFGSKVTLDPLLKEALIRTGTLHIAALSGMNITILISLTATTLLRAFSRRITSLLTIIIIIGFVSFVGVSPSVIRAAIMGCLSLFATVLGRQQSALFSLLLVGGMMVLLHTAWLTDISFLLSFLATLGLILFAKKPTTDRLNALSTIDMELQHRKTGILVMLKNFLSDDLRTTLSAQVFTTPLLFFAFHRLSLIAPLSNILIGWVIAPLTIAGLLTCFLAVIWLPLAVPLSYVLYALLEYLRIIIMATSSLPFASIEW